MKFPSFEKCLVTNLLIFAIILFIISAFVLKSTSDLRAKLKKKAPVTTPNATTPYPTFVTSNVTINGTNITHGWHDPNPTTRSTVFRGFRGFRNANVTAPELSKKPLWDPQAENTKLMVAGALVMVFSMILGPLSIYIMCRKKPMIFNWKWRILFMVLMALCVLSLLFNWFSAYKLPGNKYDEHRFGSGWGLRMNALFIKTLYALIMICLYCGVQEGKKAAMAAGAAGDGSGGPPPPPPPNNEFVGVQTGPPAPAPAPAPVPEPAPASGSQLANESSTGEEAKPESSEEVNEP